MELSSALSALVVSCLDAAARSYLTCPVAVSADVLVPPFFWRVPLDEAEERFANFEYGVYCGGNAWHLVQVLAAADVEAYAFNFAVADGVDGLTHVIVLARVEVGLIALDPYYGHYLVGDGARSPFPFQLHLDELRREGISSGRWARLPAVEAKTLVMGDPATIRVSGTDWLRSGETTFEGLQRSRLVLRSPAGPAWPETLSRRDGAPSAEVCERGVLEPLTIADESGQSLGLGQPGGPAPAAVVQLARELGFPAAGADRRAQQA